MSADAGKPGQRWLLLHGTPLRPMGVVRCVQSPAG